MAHPPAAVGGPAAPAAAAAAAGASPPGPPGAVLLLLDVFADGLSSFSVTVPSSQRMRVVKGAIAEQGGVAIPLAHMALHRCMSDDANGSPAPGAALTELELGAAVGTLDLGSPPAIYVRDARE